MKSLIKKALSLKNILIVLSASVFILIFFFILSLTSILIDSNLTFNFSTKGISTFFQIYQIPFTIAAALLAVLTLYVATQRSIVADIQIIEMQRQREVSYQPDIIIEQRKIFIKTGTGKPIIESNRILGNDDKQFLEINLDEKGDKEPNIFLHNIGRGVAKNFKYRFLYDANACISLMNNFKVNNYFVLDLRKNNVEIFTKGTPQARFWGMFPNENWNTKIDFILPISGSQSPAMILMPYLYTILNFFKDELHSHSGKEFDDPYNILNLFPKLIFECEYLDIGLKTYRKKFEIKITFNVFSSMLDNNYRFIDKIYEYDVVPTEVKEVGINLAT